MDTLSWHYGGFGVLARKNWADPCKNDPLQSLICTINHQNSQPRNLRLFTARCSANDLAIAENPTSREKSSSRNNQLWTALEMAEALDGEIIRSGPPGTICVDTRKLVPGQWFFALHGEHFDGHDFINEALADHKGCVGIIGNRVCKNWRRGFMKVEGDTMVTLEKMAMYCRSRFHGIAVGLTGSAGKTTTRTMIGLALESLGRVYQTRGNLNTMVGVALTLIRFPVDAEAWVVEVGMGGTQGEILKLAQMCRPSVRVILNVGYCHMEHFRSLEEVAKAKGELLMEAVKGDICVLNADDPLVMSIPVPFGVKKVLFGRTIGCHVRLVLAEYTDGGRAVRVILESRLPTYDNQFSTPNEKTGYEMVEFKIHGPGLHLAMNACAAAAVAVSLGVSLHQIGEAISRFRPVCMRSELEVARNGITIINDSYNANVTSMMAAIKSLQSMDCNGQRVAILGDMFELGDAEAWAHEMVLDICCRTFIGLLMLAGKRFHAAATKLNLLGECHVISAPDSASLAAKVSEFLVSGDVVLVKGSRGMEMETVVKAIKVIDK